MAVSIYTKGENVIIDGEGISANADSPRGIDITDIHQFIEQSQKGSDEDLVGALLDGTLLIMSDGSAKNNGAAAWIITSELLYRRNIEIMGYVEVPLCRADSYRAECLGIYGGLWSLHQLIQRHNSQLNQRSEVTFQIGCDNISALHRCLNTQHFPTISGRDSDFDIIGAVRSLLPELPQFQWRHVKGHQQGPDLDIWAVLNNRVDEVAGASRERAANTPPPNVFLPGEKWQLFLEDRKVYKNIQSQIYDHLSRITILPYWTRKDRISQEAAEQVNWDAMGIAMQQSSPRQRQWITKRASRECGANSVLFRRKAKPSDTCPFCNQEETVLHVLRCQDDRA